MSCTFTEFVYTGNHADGKNSSNYDELEEYFRTNGFIGDFEAFFYEMKSDRSGTHSVKFGGKEIIYHIQRHVGSKNQFGYTYSFTVTLKGIK